MTIVTVSESARRAILSGRWQILGRVTGWDLLWDELKPTVVSGLTTGLRREVRPVVACSGPAPAALGERPDVNRLPGAMALPIILESESGNVRCREGALTGACPEASGSMISDPLPKAGDLPRLRPLSQRGESAATPCRTDLVLGGEGRPCLESELSAWADRTPPGSPQGEPLASGPVSQPITGHLTNTPAAPLPSMGIMGRSSSPIGQAAADGRPQDRIQEEGKSPAALPGDFEGDR